MGKKVTQPTSVTARGKRIPGNATAGKEPRFPSIGRDDRPLRFRFGRLDHGRWSLSDISRDHHVRLLKRLKYFEDLTVRQARANHVLADYDMADCRNQQAATRLAMQYEGQDSLCCLRVEPSGPLRLLGIREGNEFHIVWWDPNHDVWPENKQVR